MADLAVDALSDSSYMNLRNAAACTLVAVGFAVLIVTSSPREQLDLVVHDYGTKNGFVAVCVNSEGDGGVNVEYLRTDGRKESVRLVTGPRFQFFPFTAPVLKDAEPVKPLGCDSGWLALSRA